MTSCVVKWCKTRKEASKKQTEITYHRFPKKETQRLQWIAAVRLERKEDDWLPTNASRVCSIHFGTEDLYLSHKGYQMLKKSAVPICTMVRNNSLHLQKKTLNEMVQEWTERQKQTTYSEVKLTVSASETATSTGNIKESYIDADIENTGTFYYIEVNPVKHLKSHMHVYGNSMKYEKPTSSEPDAINNSDEEKSLQIEIMPQHHADTPNGDKTERALCVTPISIPSSDIESVFDSPRKQHLKQQLRRKTLLAEKRLKKIKNLQRVNKRLLKRNKTLKCVIKSLKNKGFGNS